MSATAGSLEVTSGGSGTPSLTGEVSGTFTVDNAAMLAIPAALALDGTGTNNGTINLTGQITGAGTLANSGTIVVSGSGWSADGHGPNATGGATITGNAFELKFDAPAAAGISNMWVFAPTLASSGETLPAITPVGGYQTASAWKSGSTAIDTSTALAPLASGGVIALSAYTQLPAGPRPARRSTAAARRP